MKRWPKVILAVGLVALLACTLLACGGGGGGAPASTPEGTVRNFLNALQALDVNGMAACCIGDALEEVRDMGQPPPGATIRISNIRLDVVSQSDTNAEIDAQYNVWASAYGETYEDRIYETYYLVKFDGRWYIEEWYEEYY